MQKESALGIVRHVLTFGGGLVTANGYASADEVTSGIGAVVTAFGVCWSIYDKFQAAKNKKAATGGFIQSRILAALAILTLALLSGLFLGCANTTTSKYHFKDPSGREGSIELPKDIQAEGLDVKTAGGSRIKIAKLNSAGNSDQTKAQGEREAANLQQLSGIAGQVTEGAVKGAKGF